MSGPDELLQYVNDCIKGDVVCCTKHKQACQRFLKDYGEAEKKDSKFIFNWDKVDKVLQWSVFFKHTKGVLTGKPIVLHISQVFLVANIYGFYYRETGYRRFQKFYLQVGRKNAKSQLLAVILTYELMVFTGGMAVFSFCKASFSSPVLDRLPGNFITGSLLGSTFFLSVRCENSL